MNEAMFFHFFSHTLLPKLLFVRLLLLLFSPSITSFGVKSFSMPKRFVLLACSVAFLSCFLVESQEVCPDKAPSLIKWSEWALAKAVTSNTTVITIPAGVSILFDMPAAPSFFSFGGILVDGSLILQDNGADGANVELHTQYVIARDGGSIIAGSECCPYQGQLDIVLYGDKSEADVENLGTKVLGATRGGSLSLHGQVATPTWTSLAATAVKGSSEIVLSEPVNWKVGDNLVLPSTDFDMKQVDGGAIKAISADKKTISLDFKLKYMHFGEIVGVGKSHDDSVDERGEVGHLSRRINVRGAQDAGNKIGNVPYIFVCLFLHSFLLLCTFSLASLYILSFLSFFFYGLCLMCILFS